MSIEPFESTYHRDGMKPAEIQLLQVCQRDARENDQPSAWVLVRRVEKYTYERGTKDAETASIVVSYLALDADVGPRTRTGGSFAASYSKLTNRISLTGLSPDSRGGIMMEDALRGMRLGTFVFNIIVKWAKQWPSANINSIELAEVDAYAQNKERRNRFYERFGLVFDYADVHAKGGSSRVMPAGELSLVTTWQQNIRVHHVDAYLGRMLQDNCRLRSDLDARERAIRELSRRLDHQAAHPLRTALRALWTLHAAKLVLLLVILVFVAEYYWVRRH
jgi:GNAT superfamily N-acetyltransferase